MKAAFVLAAIGLGLALTGYSLMRAAASSPNGNGLLGTALAFVGVVLIGIAAVRCSL